MADNFTFKDAGGVNRTARAKDNSNVHLPATVLSDELGNLIAADDAAAAGPIFPIAGLYSSSITTVDEVDNGDIGRIRMSARRGLISSPDYRYTFATESTVGSAGDIQVSTTAVASGYASPTTAFFDGADAGFGAGERFIRFPMQNWNECTILVQNLLGINVTIKLYIGLNDTTFVAVYSESALANGTYVYTPYAVATGGSTKQVEILKGAAAHFAVGITPASDPSSGSIRVHISRK